MIMLLLLPVFFMYVFPVIMLYQGDPVYTKPIVATGFLIIGLVLWAFKKYMIIKLIRLPKVLKKKHMRVQEMGKAVQAKIVKSRIISDDGPHPEVVAEMEFENLAGNKVKAIMRSLDSKPHERRFEVGKTMDLKLNQNGYDPAFTVATAEYETGSRLLYWLWLLFDVVYAVGLFLLSYKVQSNGLGWRFLNPVHSWILSPITGIFIMGLMSKLTGAFGDPTQDTAYEFVSTGKNEEINQILLHGKSSIGEVLSFNQTGTYVNEQPQIRFNIQYQNEYGDMVKANHKQVVSLTDLHSLKHDMIEVVYVPGNKNLYMFNYV